MEKGLVKRQLNLEAKLNNIAYQIENRKDDTVDFRLMGIDHLYVDESHRFKNLTFTTRHDRVAGLGNAEGSQRALNMLFDLRTIQEMSLDMRLIDPVKYGDHVDNKASHVAKMVSDYYQKFDEHKGTQFIFSDLGTYKPGEWNPCSEIKRKLMDDYGIPANEIRFIQEAKTDKARKAMI